MLFWRASEVKFGTSGWRVDVKKEFTDKNVLRVAQGIASFLKTQFQGGTGIIGFDARPTSQHAAELVSGIIAANGFEALMSDSPSPTPAITKTVIDKNAIGGIEVTASHNPSNYNGIKFIQKGGIPSLNETTSQIEKLVPSSPPKQPQQQQAKPINVREEYILALSKKLDLSKAIGMHVVVDPMFGGASGYLAQALSTRGVNVDEIRNVHGMGAELTPNPKKENIAELISHVQQRGADFGLANDGDGDRIVAVDQKGNYYPSHMIGLILADYMYSNTITKGPIVRSLATPSAIDNLAKKYGIPLIETNVGFKYLGAELAKGAGIAVEESGGVGLGWWIPDKDGVAAGAYLTQAISNYGKPLDQIWQDLAKEYNYGAFTTYDFEIDDKLKTAIEFLYKDTAREMFGGRKIASRNYNDGIKFTLDDGSWVLIRKSNTEPQMRVYIESKDARAATEIEGAVNRFFGEWLP